MASICVFNLDKQELHLVLKVETTIHFKKNADWYQYNMYVLWSNETFGES